MSVTNGFKIPSFELSIFIVKAFVPDNFYEEKSEKNAV
jgi:hypothetical protein